MATEKCRYCGHGFEILIGAETIAGYLQLNTEVVRRMLRQGRLPGKKDGRQRWITSKSLIDRWLVASGAARKKTRRKSSKAQSHSSVAKFGSVGGVIW